MQNHNEYLKKIDEYLSDLNVMDKVRLIEEMSEEIEQKDVKQLEPPLEYVNRKRISAGFYPYAPKKPFSLLAFFFKFIGFSVVFFSLIIGIAIYKFSPIFKVDEETNRVIILGGLIDINGDAGKVKILDQYHFDKSVMGNDLQATMALEPEKDEIIVNFISGSFQVETSRTGEFSLDCKLAVPAPQNIIQTETDYVRLNLKEIDGAACELKVPVDKKITFEGEGGNIQIVNPEFNIYIDMDDGRVAIQPENEMDYKYQISLANGMIGEFESVDSDQAYEININLDNGSVVRK